jgi:hypothetical protein
MEKSQSEMDLMLRTLLERRFQLKVHWETKELPIYELTLAKAGKLRRGSCTTFNPDSGATGVPASSFGQGLWFEQGHDVPASIFTVLWEQLGVKLKEGRGPVEVLIVDHVEKRRQISNCRCSECLAVTAGWTRHTAKLASL